MCRFWSWRSLSGGRLSWRRWPASWHHQTPALLSFVVSFCLKQVLLVHGQMICMNALAFHFQTGGPGGGLHITYAYLVFTLSETKSAYATQLWEYLTPNEHLITLTWSTYSVCTFVHLSCTNSSDYYTLSCLVLWTNDYSCPLPWSYPAFFSTGGPRGTSVVCVCVFVCTSWNG